MRRIQILNTLLYICGGVVLVLIGLLIVLSGGVSTANLTTIGELAALVAAIGVALGLVRARLLEPAAHTLFIALTLATIATSLPTGATSSALYTLFIPIVGATLLLRPGWSFGYAGIALASYLIVYLYGQRITPPTVGGVIFSLVLFGAFYGIVALLSFLSARGYERVLSASLAHSDEIEQARSSLEERVAERTRALEEALASLQSSAEQIREMSVPVMPVADGVLLLPVVGTLDSSRAALLTERLLDAVQREGARTVLIDITGVPVVDTQVAGSLLRAAQGVRLLGAEPVLVGIRAEVAQTMIGLGVDLNQVSIKRDLRSGLADVLGAGVAK